MKIRIALALSFAISTPALACIWTTDTIKDEVQLERNAADFELITGQFPHRGAGYWAAVKRRALQALKAEPKSIKHRNDLGAALLKLEDYAASEEVFKALEAEEPERYETLSNLGVLYKKMGRLEDAASYTKKALKIKPSGHLGLGDTYLAMLRYRVELQDGKRPQRDFLGEEYRADDRYSARDTWTDEAAKARISALIRSDRRFPDALFTFGEVVLDKRQRNMRLWAYVRALQLGHPRPDVLRRRIEDLLEYWREAAGAGQNIGFFGKSRVESYEDTVAGITAELEKAEAWLARYEETEGELVAKAEAEENPLPDFETVLAEMKRRGIEKIRPGEHGILSASAAAVDFQRPVDWLVVIVVLFILFSISKRWRRARAIETESRKLAKA